MLGDDQPVGAGEIVIDPGRFGSGVATPGDHQGAYHQPADPAH
jgi:hypothetical protein